MSLILFAAVVYQSSLGQVGEGQRQIGTWYLVMLLAEPPTILELYRAIRARLPKRILTRAKEFRELSFYWRH